mgnify:CR=1 FL=1
MTDDIKAKIEAHKLWVQGKPGGTRADLGGAYLGGADLGGADLRGAYLGGADLRGADLRGADLRGADLGGADLRDADLGGADLRGAYLGDADLGGARPGWRSHALISELLRREAGDDLDKRSLAGLVAISVDWCFDEWIPLIATHPLASWAVETLRPWYREGDEPARHLRRIFGGPPASPAPEGSIE